jgi:hypothetical protein
MQEMDKNTSLRCRANFTRLEGICIFDHASLLYHLVDKKGL